MPLADTTANPSSSEPGSTLEQTLHFITSVKLNELQRQRVSYQTHAKVLEDVAKLADEGDVIHKVELLAHAVKSWPGFEAPNGNQVIGGKLHLGTLDFWLQQAKEDPSFNLDVARGWAEILEAHIRHTGMRLDCANLFGNLCNEWLASGDSSALVYQAGKNDEEDGATDSDSIVMVEASGENASGGKESQEQKEKMISIIFDEPPVDIGKLSAYLEAIFSEEEASKALGRVRTSIHEFGYRLRSKCISVLDVRHAIKGLLASALMSQDQRTTLKSIEGNAMILTEVASVLNMRLANLDSWSWPKEGLAVDMRRHLNDRFRAFTDPEIVDGILLHYLGVAWQVELKMTLQLVLDSKAWNRPSNPSLFLPQEQLRQMFQHDGSLSIDAHRSGTYRNVFFFNQLHDAAIDPKTYDDLVDFRELEVRVKNSPAFVKQKLLHVMTTECNLNKTLHGTHTIVRSDLEMFGPSLPHISILTILEFLGMSKQWLSFINSFLSTPMRFSGDSEARMRKRGTPTSYALSTFCGEAILFFMDFAVNQRTNGLVLYRMHDDLWLWDADAKQCADGWAEMNKYATLVGMKFNPKKTGSAFFGPETSDHALLPKGDIRWGFLKFDPEKACFAIDQKELDLHIVELRRRLAFTKSVFGWVDAYNKYMAYFLKNFGGIPANCFGEGHVTDIVKTLARIQRELFPDSKTGAVGHLRKVLEERFDMKNLPEGYFYFSVASGGLELRNTMVEIFALQHLGKPIHRAESKEATLGEDVEMHMYHPEGMNDIDIAPVEQKFSLKAANDIKDYTLMQLKWNAELLARRQRNGYWPGVSDEFMTFEEYTSLRQSRLLTWGRLYETMLRSPQSTVVPLVPQVMADINAASSGRRGKTWAAMNWYDKWVTSMYGEEVVKKFGRLEVVDPSLIPVGIVELYRTSKMKLEV